MKALRTLIAATVVLVLLSSGVFASDVTIGVSFDFVSNPIRQAEIKAIEETAAALGASIITLSAELDAQRQVSQVEDLINRGVDAIIILPHDQDVIVSAIRRANRENIPVITIDRRAGAGGEVLYHVGAGPYLDGRDAAQFMVYTALATGKKLTVLELVGSLNDDNAIERQRGFLEIVNRGQTMLSRCGKRTTGVAARTCPGRNHGCFAISPGHQCYFHTFDFLGPAIVSALEINDKLHRRDILIMSIVGIDGNDFAWENIGKGYYTATIATLADELGRKAAEAAIKAARGETLSTSEDIISGLLVHKANQELVKDLVWGAQGF